MELERIASNESCRSTPQTRMRKKAGMAVSFVAALGIAMFGCDVNPASPSPQKKCNPGIVGNLSAKPEIKIVGLKSGDSTVRGSANNIDSNSTRVVLWAKTNDWYVQPLVAAPYTQVCSDGSWENTTHPWYSMVALLVDSNYSPGAIKYTHPSKDKGVVAWTEYP